MLVEHHNSWSWVRDYTSLELDWLDDYLSAPITRYTREGGWSEERYRMLSAVNRRFASGLAALAAKAAATDGIDFTLDDQRGAAPCSFGPRELAAWNRDYQHRCVDQCMLAVRGVVKAPTGSGKTEMIVALTRRAPCEWLALTHRVDLVAQLADRYHLRTGETAGTFAGGVWKRGSCNLTVSTFQSVFRAARQKPNKRGDLPKLVMATRGLLIDEVHGQSATTYYRGTQLFEHAYFRFGFSGTPLHRGDEDALLTIGAVGPIVASVSYQELVDAGVLAQPIVRAVQLEQKAGKNGGWVDTYQRLVSRSIRRNTLISNICERAALPCLVFVDELKHGKFLVDRIAGSGFRVEFVHGKHPPAVRREGLRKLAEGELDILICTVIFQEGIDVPSLRSVVVAGGKSSSVACLQRAGRGMRRAPGKETFELWDVLDVGQEWLERHAQDRLATLRSEGIPVEVIERF